jgi:hypothetical protein
MKMGNFQPILLGILSLIFTQLHHMKDRTGIVAPLA